jgi:hypothetical protein
MSRRRNRDLVFALMVMLGPSWCHLRPVRQTTSGSADAKLGDRSADTDQIGGMRLEARGRLSVLPPLLAEPFVMATRHHAMTAHVHLRVRSRKRSVRPMLGDECSETLDKRSNACRVVASARQPSPSNCLAASAISTAPSNHGRIPRKRSTGSHAACESAVPPDPMVAPRIATGRPRNTRGMSSAGRDSQSMVHQAVVTAGALAVVWLLGADRKGTANRFHALIAMTATVRSTSSFSLKCARTSS